ncbi:basigin isoform X2 [Cephus cinctus]|uniref:Basigin isoform X2 n=1 Tax=Cephus cinctus TaxID=211228 RepID=A0AAJ7VYH1_CEPCN|nr:basigin isoform X2 [Cephus cinctus]
MDTLRGAFTLLSLLFLATSTVHAGNMFRVLSNESVPLTLKCGEATSKDVVRWFKEKHDLLAANASEEFKKLQEFITVDTTTGTLVIKNETNEVLGNYSCTLNGVSQEFKVVPKPTAVLPHSTTVIEGEKLHVVCNGKQSPGVKIIWTFGGKNYTKSSDRVKLSIDKDRGINGAVLTVENINMSDRGDIYCRVSYNWTDRIPIHRAEAKILLRVKDKLAALWPFLGICAEVFVLCAIILIYEKKRNKAELEESDTDQSPDTKPTPNKDSDVRQRK